jgi:hypothetical protein
MELRTTQEAIRCAVTQKLSTILWNREDHYGIHKGSPITLKN